MLIHLPIIILTSLHPTPIADAMRNSMLRGSASSKAARRRNRAGARPKRRKRATNFERNGHNLLPAKKPSATRKPARAASSVMSNCRRASEWRGK